MHRDMKRSNSRTGGSQSRTNPNIHLYQQRLWDYKTLSNMLKPTIFEFAVLGIAIAGVTLSPLTMRSSFHF